MWLLAEAPTPLDGLASAASVILIMEIGLIILLFAVLAVLIALLVHWLYRHMIPPVQRAVPRVNAAVASADRATGRVIDVVADLYGRRRSIEDGIRAFFETLFPLDEEQQTGAQRATTESEEPSPSP